MDTDELLSAAYPRDGITKLELELTDISDAGMQHVATMSNLETLVIHGGRPGIGDAGLRKLKGHQSLTCIQLTNTNVTNNGLAVLRDMPRLENLKRYYEEWRGELLTDEAFQYLASIENLKTLAIGGGWATKSGIRLFQETCPDCDVEFVEE